LRAYLGTIPDYAPGDVVGVKLVGVAKGGPAEQAGVRGGDVIVELAGKKVENIYDYTYAVDALQIGVPVSLVVLRGEQRLMLTVTPGSRE
jgi:S1-C subfamily serine protease